jgi:predicted nucleic acid-binding protein
VIVVDTNVLVYLVLPGEHTEHAERVLHRDPVWTAPLLWRSEFRNVLAVYMRQGRLSLDHHDANSVTNWSLSFLLLLL